MNPGSLPVRDSTAISPFDALAAPTVDGDVLCVPAPSEWPAMVERNRQLRQQYAFVIHGRSAGEWVRSAGDARWLLTGHQPEFFHPGVWAKNVAAAAAAARMSARCGFLIVENDAPDGTALRWPEEVEGRLRAGALAMEWRPHGVTFEQQPPADWRAAWSRLPESYRSESHAPMSAFVAAFLNPPKPVFEKPIPSRSPAFPSRDREGAVSASPFAQPDDERPDPASCGEGEGALSESGSAPLPHGRGSERGRGSEMQTTSRTCSNKTVNDSGASDYVRRWMAGITALDHALGVSTPAMIRVGRPSSLHEGRGLGWGGFATHLCARAAEFAAAYNGALADYRAARRIRGTQHPIPDLTVTADRIELPLWAWTGHEPRQRVYATPGQNGAATVWAGERRIGRVPDEGALSPNGDLLGWRIRPRALTLTMYARLFLCDLFIHGLGGAKYDVITDELIRRFFGVEPPAYACVTATLRLPLGREVITPADRFAALRRVRDARFNPQRLLCTSAPPNLLADRAAAIAESDRLRREQPSQRTARRRVLERIRSLNGALSAMEPNLETRAESDWTAMQRRLADQIVAQSREWFYGLYPATRLFELAGRLGTAFR